MSLPLDNKPSHLQWTLWYVELYILSFNYTSDHLNLKKKKMDKSGDSDNDDNNGGGGGGGGDDDDDDDDDDLQ